MIDNKRTFEKIPLNLPKSDAECRQVERQINNLDMMKYYGIHLDLSDLSRIIFSIPVVKSHHRGGIGSEAVNGGVIAAICDFAIGIAGSFQLPDGKKATIDLHVKYLKALFGDSVRAVSSVERVRSRMVTVAVEVLNDQNEICATAVGRVFYVPSSG